MSKKPRWNPNSVVLDVDGVVLDCDGGFAAVAVHVLGRPVSKVSNAYDLRLRYALTQGESDRVWDAMDDHPRGWRGFDVMPGARRAYFRLRSLGLDIHMVTAIPEARRALREECLERHGMLPDSLQCVGNYGASKEEAINSVRPIMVVDDRLWHLHEVPGVPYRVFVDHGDDQEGLVVDEEIIQVKSLDSWVDKWELLIGRRQSPRLSVVG